MSSALKSPVRTAAFLPALAGSPSVARKTFLFFAATIVLAVSSWIEVPMVPVPMTLQTLAVVLVGAAFGAKLGFLAVAAWLAEGAIGLPVLAGGAAGAHHFVGPTAGYLFAFPVMAYLVGLCAERGWTGHRLAPTFAVMLGGHALCFALGWAWLSVLIGPEPAFTHGVAPFLIGALVKSALAAALLRTWKSAHTRLAG